MIFRMESKAGVPLNIERVGAFFTLVSCSAGKARVKVFDSKGRELFASVLPSGATIELDEEGARLELETEIDAEVSLFWSKSKFNNPVVNVLGAGIARTKSVVVNGLAKLNTVNGQNKKIKLKAREGDVTLTGQASRQNGGWLLRQGEEVELDTSGDIFARGAAQTMVFNMGSPVTSGPAGITYYSTAFDKVGNLYGNGTPSGGITGIDGAPNNWPANMGKITKWRDKLFVINVGGGNSITIVEILNGVMIPRHVVSYSLALGSQPPNDAVFSNDGNFVLCNFANAAGGAECVIFDLAARKVSANWKRSSNNVLYAEALPYLDGFMLPYGNTLHFVSVGGQFSQIEYTGDSINIGMSGAARMMGGTIALMDPNAFAIWVSYDNSMNFTRIGSRFESPSSLAVIGDLVCAIGTTGLYVHPRFGIPNTYGLGALTSKGGAFGAVYVAPNGAVTYAYTLSAMAGDAQSYKLPIGTLTGPSLPEIVDVAELF